ncbi:DUF2851 family protein [Parabacteroides pacaensis]|uniref:DUF2851 family protein n=1 Tax=Parabacteroides pacaensis TaxID=2086575 RepID=UPI000D0F63F2|nr:DUF2851 family protein [Parabacteroides pacaensis]
MERLLQYVWKYKLYTQPYFITGSGQMVSIIDPGIANPHAGPDFFNAKIKIDQTVWIGNVELHLRASDWKRHGHHTDRVYDSVILHVVNDPDVVVHRMSGEIIPQITLSIPTSILENYTFLLTQDRGLPCQERIQEIERLYLVSWMEALVSERMERKTKDILTLLEQYKGDWNEIFYITLTRNFGFGTNSDAFERLAKSLPLRYIQKHKDNPLQIEALLFGQAGMLEEMNEDSYYLSLQKEYRFLQHKFNLHSLDSSQCKSLRIRPANFPHIKLAQLAALWLQEEFLFSAVLNQKGTEELRNLFRVTPSLYWETHYHFRYASIKKQKIMGDNALNILLINTVAPILFAYGIHCNLPEYTERALVLLESLPPENNSIITLFRRAGLSAEQAADTQALIQLKREYCEKNKCLYCRIGFKLLQKK